MSAPYDLGMSASCRAPHRTAPERFRGAADGLLLCPGCVERLERDIKQLPRLYAELATRLAVAGDPTPAGGSGNRGGKGGGRPLPVNLSVVEARDQIAADLRWHARWVCTERGLAGPGSDAVDDMARWLLAHVAWMSAQDDAADVAGTFAELGGRARFLLDPRQRSKFPVNAACLEVTEGGPCPGQLFANLTAGKEARIECDECGTTYPATTWLRLGRRIYAAALKAAAAAIQAEAS